ncbi:alanine/glycine:cation symporter family protein [Nitrosococcus watsonii]|uniref:Amino acid carrier protein n=1 Tax=Nitrosococcus watsoni (strain C-113) TaxID=105559 RepID=D8KBB3_NITWC|nr:alanine/glycine:cation symporter family protein [Nitrosococcus watsonii]ADJ29560.1 amino acid carrier protein [Nitrosococcus watsonii C-113]
MQQLECWFTAFAAFMWGMPLVLLLVGGGTFLVFYSRCLPYLHFRHSIGILLGRYDDPDETGEIPHFQALTTALSGTLGLGNLAGVAVAITMGGPGAIFWMWVTAVVGVATKFYTCTLAIMYRGRDSRGAWQGGPMYVIREGLGRRWLPLAGLFAVAGMVGTLPVFQANQLVQITRDLFAIPLGWARADEHLGYDVLTGVLLAAATLVIILGNIQRIGKVTAALVPGMVLFYLLLTLVILVQHGAQIPGALALIFSDAFSGHAVAGGALGTVILMGVRRGAFSNEAGIGTEVMAHGAAKTSEPVREGLVAMLGPVIDTLLVCTCTALVILITGVWQGETTGVTLTAEAFEDALPGAGGYLLTLLVIFLSLSTIITFWYYGAKCLGFLIGAEYQHHYVWIYGVLIVAGSVVSLETIIGLVDGMYAMMAIPTMAATLLLAPKVNAAARRYFNDYSAGRH